MYNSSYITCYSLMLYKSYFVFIVFVYMCTYVCACVCARICRPFIITKIKNKYKITKDYSNLTYYYEVFGVISVKKKLS